MIGHVESFDRATQTGVIKYEDSFYEFHMDQWNSGGEPEAGDDVNFELAEGDVKSVNLLGEYLQPQPVKSRIIAVLLALVLGGVGAHRLYLGFYGIAIAQLAVTLLTGGYGVLWGFIEFVLLLTKNMNADAKGRPLK